MAIFMRGEKRGEKMYNHVEQLVSCSYKYPTGELPISIIYKIQELKKISFFLILLLNCYKVFLKFQHKSFALFDIILFHAALISLCDPILHITACRGTKRIHDVIEQFMHAINKDRAGETATFVLNFTE
jgi:hypothetical protein